MTLDKAGADLDWPGADRLMEDADAADDRGEVGGHGGQRDDLDALADLKAAGGGIEGDHSIAMRDERPSGIAPARR